MTTPPDPQHSPPDNPADTASPSDHPAATPDPGGHDPASRRPATVADQAAAALDVSENVLEMVEEIVQRLTAVEEAVAETQRRGPGSRTDYRFEHYPKAETDADQASQVQRVRAAWERLDDWVAWLTGTYRLTSVIPSCWADHTALREELIGLRVAWIGAWSPRASHDAITIFHERLWNARARLLDGNWGNARCDGHHTVHDVDRGDGVDDRADPRAATGFDLVDSYRVWANDPHRDRALRTARDRSLTTVRASWTNPAEHTTEGTPDDATNGPTNDAADGIKDGAA